MQTTSFYQKYDYEKLNFSTIKKKNNKYLSTHRVDVGRHYPSYII